MREIALLAAAGALGTVSRYAVSTAAIRYLGNNFPYGTLTVNLVGSFLLGMLAQLGLRSDVIPNAYVLPITVGFLGAFTTFSTFSYETTHLVLDKGSWTLAAVNIIANIVLGSIGTISGVLLGRTLAGSA